MANTSLIIFLVIAFLLLFTNMVLSALAADRAKDSAKKCKEDCHKYSMWSAIVSGVTVFVMIVITVLYIYSSRKAIASTAQQHLAAAHQALGGVAGNQAVGIPSTPGGSYGGSAVGGGSIGGSQMMV